MICEGQTISEIVNGIMQTALATKLTGWAARLAYIQPRNIVELGTGQGASGVQFMEALHPDATFTTINYDYPADYGFGEQLYPWKSDPRLTMLMADTINPDTINKVKPDIDLLYIDSHHEAWHAALEMSIWQDVLCDGAIVFADDLTVSDMHLWWDSLPYMRHPIQVSYGQGMFRFRKEPRYSVVFPRGQTGKEGARP